MSAETIVFCSKEERAEGCHADLRKLVNCCAGKGDGRYHCSNCEPVFSSDEFEDPNSNVETQRNGYPGETQGHHGYAGDLCTTGEYVKHFDFLDHRFRRINHDREIDWFIICWGENPLLEGNRQHRV